VKMNKTQIEVRKAVLKYCKRKMARLVEFREKTTFVPLPELPEDIASCEVTIWSDIEINVGFSPENVLMIYEKMKTAGWECHGRKPEEVTTEIKGGNKSNCASYWYHDDYKGGSIVIWFIVGLKGSNCQRVKIGTEQVDKDIFEIVCNEGVEEAEGAI